MKKYNFPLQKVLEYDTHIQNKEMDKLSSMQSEYRELETKRSVEVYKHEQSKSKYQKCCEEGIQVIKATAQRLFIEQQKELIVSLNTLMAEKKKLIDLQVEKLLEITKDKMTIEKLRERSLAQYKGLERKSEEVFIEEFIANKTVEANS